MNKGGGVLNGYGKPRRGRVLLSTFGITYLYRNSPGMVAWWSAAFPGLGHLILRQNLRGVFLTLFEVGFNTLSHLNEAIVYSFSGRFEQARQVLDPRWVYGYIMIYLFAIYDSYRSAKQMNKMSHLAELEDGRIGGYTITPMEIQYLELQNPWAAAAASLFFPGLGQMYNHRICLAFYIMLWWTAFAGFSYFGMSLLHLYHGHIRSSTEVLQPHWLLFMPSFLWGAVYQSYMTSVEQNLLFRMEQRQYLTEQYGYSDIALMTE